MKRFPTFTTGTVAEGKLGGDLALCAARCCGGQELGSAGSALWRVGLVTLSLSVTFLSSLSYKVRRVLNLIIAKVVCFFPPSSNFL